MNRHEAVFVVDRLRKDNEGRSLAQMHEDDALSLLHAWYIGNQQQTLFVFRTSSGAARRVEETDVQTILRDLVGRYGSNVYGYEKRAKIEDKIEDIRRSTRFTAAVFQFFIPVEDPLRAFYGEQASVVFGKDVQVRGMTYSKQALIDEMKHRIRDPEFKSAYFIQSTHLAGGVLEDIERTAFLRTKEIRTILRQDTARFMDIMKQQHLTESKALVQFHAEVEALISRNNYKKARYNKRQFP